MQRRYRLVALAIGAAILAACGGKSTDNAAPLAFIPADTPYVYANIEPTPTAVTEQWSRHMHDYLPSALATYEQMLDRLGDANKPDDAHAIAAARAIIELLKTHDTWDKLRELGLKPDMRAAFYGVGLAPVLRMELGDAAKFRAAIADIESKSGANLQVAKVGNQDYWHLGNDKVTVLLAIEGQQFVATLAPANASDALKRTLLGLDRPAKSLADSGDLDKLARQYGYSNYGEGYFDFVRIAQRLTGPAQGSDREIAEALGLPTAGVDAVCRDEYLQVADKFPRLAFGIDAMTERHLGLSAQLELEATLARQLMAALGTAPGTGAAGSGVLDVALSVPVLKLKDFWIAQADAVAAKPFACPGLAEFNAGFATMKQKIDITVPPPASDLTGLRLTLDHVEMAKAGSAVPAVSGKLLMGSTNPAAAIAMAQLALPALKDIKLGTDGKPVALPAGTLPGTTEPTFAAATATALALALGQGEDATLGDWLNTPAATDPVFFRMYFSGAFYNLLAQGFDRMKAMMPTDQQARLEQQSKMMAIYATWIKSADIELLATPTGIVMHETVDQN